MKRSEEITRRGNVFESRNRCSVSMPPNGDEVTTEKVRPFGVEEHKMSRNKAEEVLLGVMACAILLVSGCASINALPYSVSTQNVIEIKDRWGDLNKKVKLSNFTASPNAGGPINCRLVGPIDPTPGKTIPQYIRDAFQDELYLAGMYASTSEVEITANIDKLEFSSFGTGYWDITLTIASNKFSGYQVATHYEFATSFDAVNGCRNTANAFGPAVQNLIRKMVTDPQFKRLLGA